jgi:lipopolysaccharide/colanic/teichoic acid biosynthesis glycosyltransferase
MSKRIFDFLLSLCGLVISVPLWIIVVLAIYLEDGRPIFFLQERVGKDSKKFKAIKFRTMKQINTPYPDIDLLEEDPRVTRTGRLLRMTAMDELPQLINIIKGDMSFVGPKALPYAIDDEEKNRYKYLDEIPGYETRIKVRPGLTGIAQIYVSKNASRRNKFRYDNIYVRKQNLWLDIRLILISFFITFRAKWERGGKKI